MAEQKSESSARYEARTEAAPVAGLFPVVLVLLALVSWVEGWDFLGLAWWVWLVLAVPALLLCLDLWLGPRGIGIALTRVAGLLHADLTMLARLSQALARARVVPLAA